MSNNCTIREAIDKNQSKTCSVDGCGNPRYRLYSTCVHHFFKRKLYGSAKSKAIKKSELQRDIDAVTAIIVRNEEHKGIKKAESWFDNWLIEAGREAPVPGGQHIRRLLRAGITGKDMMIISAALWAYSYREPRFFPDKRSLIYGLAHQVTTLAPLEYVTTRSGKRRPIVMNSNERQAIGEYIVNNLGMLFVSICNYIEKQEREEYEARQVYGEPLL